MKKIALITGGASGIGLACAERFARDGCTVVIADLNEKAGQEHARRLEGGFIAADLSRREGCKKLVEETLRRHGTADDLAHAHRAFPPHALLLVCEPAEVADFAAYLSSDAAGVITGAALTMDLGWTAR
jgi:NAD(P)-dependent dehydrogenase (short-subunit alcohol dehydrogenase family)